MYSSRPKPPNDTPPLAFFVPRQILLLVEHEGDLKREQLAQLIRYSNDAAGDADIAPPRNILSFPRAEGRTRFSLVFADVKGIGEDQADLLRLLQRLEKLFDSDFSGLTLRAVSPNWLGVRAPQGITGGPGAKPKPARQLALRWQTADLDTPEAPYGFDFPALPPHCKAKREVEVAILDTAPCLHDLARAWTMWHAKHPLIHSLLRSHGPLTIHYAGYEELLRLAEYEIQNHQYQMADHGLFVAGITHTIAPQAKLHLYEVLNPSGVGDFESIARGLQRVLQRRSTAPLVVNCSLVVNFPSPDEIDKLAQRDPIWKFLSSDKLNRMAWALQWIFDTIHAQNVPIAAAAGNDAEPNQPRPPARFPAAFESVIGVGALEDAIHPASYANLADDPPGEGISTFGGAATQGETIVGRGVLGVYIGEFPEAPHGNTNGWAWWAGSSFATPIVSGSLAALMGQGLTPAQAEAVLRNSQSQITPAGEEIVTVDKP